ncbi:hypothetical protein T484DRAFT_1920119, partial [Baffinella frigidus]
MVHAPLLRLAALLLVLPQLQAFSFLGAPVVGRSVAQQGRLYSDAPAVALRTATATGPSMYLGERFFTRKSTKVEQAKSELIGLLAGTTALNVPLGQERNAKLDALLASVRNADDAPYLQDQSNSKEAVGGTFQTYNFASKKFYNSASLFGGFATLSATAAFTKDSEKP